MSQFRYSWLLVMAGVAGSLKAADLPVPCIAGSCGSVAPGFVSAGQAQAVQTPTSMTIDQFTDNVTLNWQSFNISADGTVTFRQPDASSVALNRIFQADASRILGSLNANGRIFLVNQNGIVFGEGARVNASGLIASSLDLTPAALERGIAQAAQVREPAFRAFTDEQGNASGGPVIVERGATIDSAGGQVLLFAPGEVTNRGTIRTPDGQTILAAGDAVFLAASTDSNLRGLLVEVGVGGVVTNGATGAGPGVAPEQLAGQIIAERGNITLAGLAVNQLGRVSATTSVRANGSIHLVARDGGSVTADGRDLLAERGGTLTLGRASHTDVRLNLADTATAVDATAQPRSQVRLDGREVAIQSAAQVVAHGGSIGISARANPGIDPSAFTSQDDGSRIRIADEALLDVSGAHIELPMERNVLRVELRANQLRDSPAQRDGPLRGEAVFIDVRRSGTRADGTPWVGSPIADLFGDVSTIARAVGERNLSGGSIRLQSQGDLVVGANARLDVSGGQIRFLDGYINTSRLVAADGSTVDIARADPQRSYRGISDPSRQVNRRWGITETYDINGMPSRGARESGYVEGKDAGSITLAAPQLVFDGALIGNTVRGIHQRTPTTTIADGAMRPFDQVARGASLIVGSATPAVPDLPDAVVNAIRFETGTTLGSLSSPSGGSFDLLRDALPDTLDHVRLRPELFGEGAARNVSLFANDSIEIPHGLTLNLGQGGAFSATAGRVQHDGVLRLPGGTVLMEARVGVAAEPGETRLGLGKGARIEAQGSWINDNPLLGGAVDPLYTSGGSVSLVARQGAMLLAGGSLIDVSGGAQRRADGRVVGGRGGSVNLENSATLEGEAFTPRLNAEIRGHSFAAGGQFSIAAPSVCIAATDCSEGEPGNLWLAPTFFSANGFADFRVRSNLGGISVERGTQISVLQLSRLPGDKLTLLPSGGDAGGAARLGSLATHELRPTSLSLNSQVAVLTSPLTREEFATAPVLTVGSGSVLRTQAGGLLSLTANTRMEVDGLLEAPAGRIDLTLDAGLRIQEFLPSQAIALGDHAHLTVAGVARTYIDGQGARRGEVLPGGSVNITARRGYVLGAPGARLDISGTRATLDLRQARGAVTGLAPSEVASAGGRLSLTAAEGILWSGNVSAAGGSERVAGGELAVTLDRPPGSDPGNLAPVAPIGPRRIELTSSLAPIVIGAGGDVPDVLNGRALLSANALAAARFDSLALTAADLYFSSTFLAFGEIAFHDVALDFRRSLTFDASLFTGRGNIRLDAPFVSFGHSDLNWQLTPENFSPGRARLAVDADHIDFVGAFSLDGFESLNFSSRGDLRLRGVQRPEARRFTGSLTTSADLSLEAAQIFPATLTDFDVRVTGNDEGEVNILARAGAPAAPVLSVGGSLSIDAPTITHRGVLRAPLGHIKLNGEDLTLAAGSVTSTSLGGQTALFGSTQAGLDWVYELPDRQSLVFGIEHDTLPTQRIALEGTRVNIAEGATVDLSGGGDLLAYEFMPGVGGSRDLLSWAERPGQFAVLPGLGASFGPYDAREFQGAVLKPGDAVYLSGTSGLAAGTYTLLPARYGLLPGAFLVSPVSGYQDINAGESFARLDGSTVISGYRTFATTGIGEARSSGFAVRPGNAIQREARYELSTANEFFSARARAQETFVPRLPLDSGQLVLSGIERLSLEGQVRSAAAAGARGAQVDISGSMLRVVPDASTASPDPNALLIDAGDISRLGAESVLLGGVRRQTEEGTEIEVRSDEVVVDRDAVLNAPEVTLVARERVAVSQGATLEARGSIAARENEPLRVRDDGALLRVSGGSQPGFERSDETGLTGRLELAAGATLRSAGSVLLDASLDTRSAATLDVAGASLRFGARQITLSAETPAPDAGLVLNPGALSSLGLRELSLSSRSTIDVASGTQLSVRELSLDAAGLRRSGGVGDARLAADVITMANRNSLMAPEATAPGGGTLTLDAGEMRLGEGTFHLLDFGDTRIGATRRWLGASGTLDASGNLRIDTPLVTQNATSDSAILAAGDLTIGTTAPGATQALDSDGIGAGLDLSGRNVVVDTRIQLPSGRLAITATGTSGSGVRLGSQARLDLGGLSRDFDGTVVGSPGGSISIDAGRGDLLIDEGAQVSVAGAAGAVGGRLQARAVGGTVRIDGSLTGGAGAKFLLDAWRLPTLDSLNAALNAGGFDGARSLRQRGPGDLLVGTSAAAAMHAHQVDLFADQGAVRIAGLIDTGESPGGRVRIGARNDVVVNGRIVASSGEEPGTHARIELDSRAGRISIGPAANLDADGGDIHLRLPRSNLLTLADANAGNDSLTLRGATNARSVTVEGFTRYNFTDGYITSAQTSADEFNPWFADASSFMAQAASIRNGLGRAEDATLHIVPGLEIFSPGDLTLLEDWNLYSWRFDGAPGVLTLRAGGDLRFSASLSDGFTTPTAVALPAVAAPSWSYRLVAGADDVASDPLAVQVPAALGETGGNLNIDTSVVRTGSGSIDVSTARDFVLGSASAVLYTAGTSGPGIPITTRGGGLGGRTYPINGGDISILAGRDVIGSPNNQLVTDWLWRSGRPVGMENPSATAWTVNFARFSQGIGALAGGRVAVSAGRDVLDLSASVPSIGRQIGGTTPAANRVEVIGGGLLEVDAGRNVIDGKYFVGRGSLIVRAGDSLMPNSAAAETSTGTVFALGDADLAALARRDLLAGAIVNPTLLPQGLSQHNGQRTLRSVFSTYGSGSAARLFAIGGDLTLLNDTGRLAAQLQSMSFDTIDTVGLRIYPPSMSAVAFDGDTLLRGSFSMYPDAAGSFELLANRDVLTQGASRVEVLMSNADPALMPSAAAPQADFAIVAAPLESGFNVSPNFNASVPVHANSTGVAHVVARTGDIAIESGGAEDSSGFYFPMPARFSAGRDVRDLSLTVIHPRVTDVTTVRAGRDVRYTIHRGERGGINRSNREMVVDGGGRLEISAGRDVDLQTAAGITTRGDVVARGVPKGGADIRVIAGLNGRQPSWQAFSDKYLRDGKEHDALLLEYIENETGLRFASKAQALAAFTALPEIRRRPLLEQVFFAELRITGRIAAPLGDRGDFTRAYVALDTLFPGSNPDLAKGEKNAYAGDIRLYFSRMYTLDGGDITLVAPGGELNAGLATPPVAFGIDKSPSQLGIVVQSQGNVAVAAFGDTQVNESRIFSADGGDILIWATRGDIDAGRGAKTAISAPLPSITFDSNGRPTVTFPAALTGSGIQTLATSAGRKPGDVDLFAPRGVVNASDAGIVAGNLTIAATAVLGANNIQVSGVSVGVPVDAGGLAAGLQGVSSVASSSASAATATVERGADSRRDETPLASAALGWLEVFVEGFGEEVCKADDPECLARQRTK